MILISNRGNISGCNPLLENTPDYIDSAIKLGYNVKIDLWYRDSKFFLGVEAPETEISWDWITDNLEYLWIQSMDTETFSFLLENGKALNFFYNKNDMITFTSKGFAWSNSGNKHTSNMIVCNTDKTDGLFGMCSDDVYKWSKQIAVCFYGDAGLPKKRVIKNHKEKMIDPLEEMGYHLEYYGVKTLNIKENDLEYNKIYNFKGLRSQLADHNKTTDQVDQDHIKSIYEMIGSHPYETAFFIRWDQKLTTEEIQDHIKTYNIDEDI